MAYFSQSPYSHFLICYAMKELPSERRTKVRNHIVEQSKANLESTAAQGLNPRYLWSRPSPGRWWRIPSTANLLCQTADLMSWFLNQILEIVVFLDVLKLPEWAVPSGRVSLPFIFARVQVNKAAILPPETPPYLIPHLTSQHSIFAFLHHHIFRLFNPLLSGTCHFEDMQEKNND